MDLPHGEKNETAAPPDAAAAAAQGGSHADAMEEEEHHAASGASPSMVGLGGGGGGAQPGEEGGGGGGAASSAATPMTTEVVAPPPVVTGTDDEAPHRSATAGEMVVEEEQEDEDEGKRSGGGGGGKQRIYVAGKMMFFNSPGRDWRGLGRFKELEWRSDQEALPLLDKMRSLRDVEVDWDENWVYVGPHFLSCPGLDHDVDYFYQLDDEPRSGSALASVLRDEQRDFTVDEREKQVLFDNARHQIGKCDVLYARLTDQKDCFWTFTEIGIAAGLGALTSPLSASSSPSSIVTCTPHPHPTCLCCVAHPMAGDHPPCGGTRRKARVHRLPCGVARHLAPPPPLRAFQGNTVYPAPAPQQATAASGHSADDKNHADSSEWLPPWCGISGRSM
jgi:hypothetical protein